MHRLSFAKVEKVLLILKKIRLDMNCSTVLTIAKKFQKTGNTLDRPGRGRKRSVRSPQLL